MTKEELPTPKELLKKVGDEKMVNCPSIAYQDSRVILNYLDKPVVAYGLGYGGFVCIIQMQNKGIKGYAYGIKRPMSSWKHGGFTEQSHEEVIKEIETNKFFVEKSYNEDSIREGKIREGEVYVRPVEASFTIKKRDTRWGSQKLEENDWEVYNYRLVRLKSGKLRAEETDRWSRNGKYHRVTENRIISEWELKEGVKEEVVEWNKQEYQEEVKKEDVNVSEEIIAELKNQVLLADI